MARPSPHFAALQLRMTLRDDHQATVHHSTTRKSVALCLLRIIDTSIYFSISSNIYHCLLFLLRKVPSWRHCRRTSPPEQPHEDVKDLRKWHTRRQETRSLPGLFSGISGPNFNEPGSLAKWEGNMLLWSAGWSKVFNRKRSSAILPLPAPLGGRGAKWQSLVRKLASFQKNLNFSVSSLILNSVTVS